jgi:Zn-dependent protease with chaperone function
MSSFYGKYFDGKTSQPQTVEVFFSRTPDALNFRNENLNINWFLYEISYESYGNFTEIRQQNQVDEFLTIDDKDFKKQLIAYLQYHNKLSVYQQLINLGFRKHLSIAVAVLAILVLGYIFAVPYIAEKSAALIPEIVDKKLGDSFIGEYLLKNEQDTAKTLLLNEFAKNINFNNRQELHFRVIKLPIVNAFALPNGEIVIFTGILKEMDNYTELAGLLGHEASHVNCRHSIKMLCRNLAGYIILSAIISDVSGIISVLAENAHGLNTLSYSRAFETEADEQAVLLMIKNHIDPNGLISLFEKIKTASETENDYKFLEYLQTHPLTSYRIKTMQKIISTEYQKDNVPYYNNAKLKSLFEEMKD